MAMCAGLKMWIFLSFPGFFSFYEIYLSFYLEVDIGLLPRYKFGFKEFKGKDLGDVGPPIFCGGAEGLLGLALGHDEYC
jgi:hypothetical protein